MKQELQSLKDTKPEAHPGYYFSILIAITVIVGLLVWKGWAEKPSVAIEYNVGEIIGGTLAGIGVLAAGLTYAFARGKTLK